MLLRLGIVGTLALSGCLQPHDDSSEVETPVPGECEATPWPMPTPTAEGLQPRTYPAYPESSTAATAEQFAMDFERAYRHNAFLAEGFLPGTDDMTTSTDVPYWAVIERPRGYIVGVTGELRTGDTQQPANVTGTPASFTGAPFAAWYYLTDRFALRKPVERIEEGDPPDLNGAITIVCD